MVAKIQKERGGERLEGNYLGVTPGEEKEYPEKWETLRLSSKRIL